MSRSASGPDPSAEALRREVAALSAQVRSLRTWSLVTLLVAIAAAMLGGFALSRATSEVATASVSADPGSSGSGMAPAGSIILGAAGPNAPVLDVYEDYQCPACARIHPYVAADLASLVDSGDVEVRFHLMSFLDAGMGNDASARAAAGAFCAHEQDLFSAYHDAMWAHHPAVEGEGWTDEQLAAIASGAGVEPATWSACVASGRHDAQVRSANGLSLAAGVNATPTFTLNGEAIDLQAAMETGGLATYVRSNA